MLFRSIAQTAGALAEEKETWKGPFGGTFSAGMTIASDYSYRGISQTQGTIRNFVREAVCHIPPNLSPKATANCVFASNHSRGGRFQSATA